MSQRFVDTATIALFLLTLVGPAIDQCVRPDEVRDSGVAEQRRASPMPAPPHTLAEVTAFPRQYEDHYDDTFGLRDVLLRWNSIERYLWLGTSPAALVDPADEGWCFYLGERARDSHRGVMPFTEEDLDGWVKRLRERRDFLASQGSRYLFVLCPSKNAIYPERTASTWQPVGPSRLDQLMERLQREGDIPYLDLRPALRAAKSGDRFEDWLYTRCGTHWNGRGIYTAYTAIVERMRADFPELTTVPLSACKEVEQKGSTDSLSRLLYISDLLPQHHYSFQTEKKGYEVLLETPARTGAKVITRKNIAAPRLLWLHDSFGPFLLMSESFSFMLSHRVSEFSADDVREARPDVVLETYVDRILSYEPPYRPIVAETVTPAELFERSREVAWREELGDRFPPSSPQGRAALERTEEGLFLRARGAKDGLRLPAFDLAAGKFALLRLTAECTEPVEVEVFVRKEGETTFPLQNHVALQLRPDAPTATVRLPRLTGRIETLLRPRAPASELLITGLEVRRGKPLPLRKPGK